MLFEEIKRLTTLEEYDNIINMTAYSQVWNFDFECVFSSGENLICDTVSIDKIMHKIKRKKEDERVSNKNVRTSLQQLKHSIHFYCCCWLFIDAIIFKLKVCLMKKKNLTEMNFIIHNIRVIWDEPNLTSALYHRAPHTFSMNNNNTD